MQKNIKLLTIYDNNNIINMLSEEYINRIKQLSGLLKEVDNREKIKNVLELPEEVANWAHEMSDKYSIWIANSLKNKIKEENIKLTNKKELLALLSNITSDYRYILDWLQGRNSPPVRENDQLNFKDLSFNNALERSKNWHEELKKFQGGKIEDEDGKVLMTFPDGFYWIDLEKSSDPDESAAMGHCGRGGTKGCTLYSLRKDKHPYVTAEINRGVIHQMKGRANTNPTKYNDYIFGLIMNPNININNFEYSGYQNAKDFKISQFTPQQIKEIVYRKPSLLKNQNFKNLNLDDNDIDWLIKNNPEVVPNVTILQKMDFEELKEKLMSKEFVQNMIKNKSFIGFINDLTSLGGKYTNLAAEALIKNPYIKSYYFNLDKNEDKSKSSYGSSHTYKESNLFAYLEMLNESGKIGKEYLKELGINTNELEELFINKGKIDVFIQLLLLTEPDFFGESGREHANKIMKDKNFIKNFIKQKGEQDYKITLSFVEAITGGNKKKQ